MSRETIADRLHGMFQMGVPSSDTLNRLTPAGFRLLREAHDALLASRSAKEKIRGEDLEMAHAALAIAREALERSYNVTTYPASGESLQDRAIAAINDALSPTSPDVRTHADGGEG